MYKLFTGKVYSPLGYIKKTLLVMRLIVILLTTTILQVSANGFAQKISISEKNASLKSVLAKIKKQTGYGFIYDESLLNKTKILSVELKDVSLERALEVCFAGQPISYSLEGKTIVLREREMPVLSKTYSSTSDSFEEITIAGKVVDEKGQGLPGATIQLKGDSSNVAIVTSNVGNFSIKVPGKEAVLIVSYVGYKTKEVRVVGADVTLTIKMEPITAELRGVEVVSTGYQSLPKERATGAFEKISNELFNRATGSSVLSRLDGVTSGLIFDKRLAGSPQLKGLSIRGLNTLTERISSPLIVLDNFPYDGDIDNLNPNDIESVTVLKDAAAASIWGARAGNGVIVINTKRGGYDKPLAISANSNVSITGKPDLYYLHPMSSSDYIDVERMLFDQGFYNNKINDVSTWPYLSPVVELLVKSRPGGTLSPLQANTQIDVFRQYDIRNDYLKYIYRNEINQQYSLNINGGGRQFNYILSGGYDYTRSGIVKKSNDRITFRSDLSYKPIKNLEFTAGTIFTQRNNNNIGTYSTLGYSSATLPYSRLADDNGTPLIIGVDHRMVFLDDPANSRFLDWKYRPLAELNASSNIVKTNDLLLNLGLGYKISDIFSAEIKYQYGKTMSDEKNWQGQDSYFTRDQINLLTQFTNTDIIRPIPLGGILGKTNLNNDLYNIRGQFNANKVWKNTHRLDAIIGAEKRENRNHADSYNTYGFDKNVNTTKTVDYTKIYPTVFNGESIIQNGINFLDQTYHFTSVYANAAYSYNDRYTMSISARKDASNLYGVKTNQKGTPLWSAGIGWTISNESFYNFETLPYIKFRATYGYQGNTDNRLSAFSVIQYSTSPNPQTGLNRATIQNLANYDLRWEKVGTLNLGLDFTSKGNRLSGSIEYYKKKSSDVLTVTPLDLTSGFSFATTNAASLKGKGVDIKLHSDNLRSDLKWNTDILFSYNTNKVTDYTPLTVITSANVLNYGTTITPVVGKSAYGIYAYKWAGLDPLNGEPRGILNGEISKDYTKLTSIGIDELEYKGSAVPVYFGGFRNTFTWKQVSLSANVVYKFGYYFRRQSINYDQLFQSGFGNADYSSRWQNPGDELKTNVPALIYPSNPRRDQFYQYSSTLVSKGDHIRLQDIVISYNLEKMNWYFKNVKLYGNISNVGIVWRANKYGLDPDYGTAYPAPRSIAFGLSANF